MTDYQVFLYNVFPELIKKINSDTPAQWGKMDAQQMIEHLAQVLSISNGRFEVTANAEPERLAYRKMRFFEKDVPFPKGLRVENVPEEPKSHYFPTIEQARLGVIRQLERFSDYHAEHPNLMPVHPVLGPLSYAEWVQFHARHCRHHLEQFGVIVD